MKNKKETEKEKKEGRMKRIGKQKKEKEKYCRIAVCIKKDLSLFIRFSIGFFKLI